MENEMELIENEMELMENETELMENEMELWNRGSNMDKLFKAPTTVKAVTRLGVDISS